MMLLSREQDRIRSGLSSGHAMAVTQPACPFSVPLNTSVSAMIAAAAASGSPSSSSSYNSAAATANAR